MALATDVYRVTKVFPRTEVYGLTNQVRRAAVGVPSNIAEGKGRLSKKEFVQFLARARGSLLEVETQVEISKNLDYLDENTFAQLLAQCREIGRLLNGLIRSIQKQTGDVSPESRELRAES